MGLFGIFLANVATYGAQRMLDVFSSVILRLSHHVIGRWLGDTAVTPRGVLSTGGDIEVIPRVVRSGRCAGAVVGVRGAASGQCQVDLESQVDAGDSLIVASGGSSSGLALEVVSVE